MRRFGFVQSDHSVSRSPFVKTKKNAPGFRQVISPDLGKHNLRIVFTTTNRPCLHAVPETVANRVRGGHTCLYSATALMTLTISSLNARR